MLHVKKKERNIPQRLMGPKTVHEFRNGHSSFCVSGRQTSTGAAYAQSWRHERREEGLFSKNMN